MYDIQGEEKESIKFGDKAGFIVGFLAVIIALYPFKDTFDSVKLDILIGSFSLSSLIIVFLILLFLSIYLYAINYIRYDFQRLLIIRWLRYIETIAHVVYLIAILYPLILLTIWLISPGIKFMIKSLLNIPPEFESSLFMSIFLGILAGISTVLFLQQIRRLQEKQLFLIEELKEEEKQFLEGAEKTYGEGLYDLFILNLYNSLIKLIESKLVREYGLDIPRISNIRLIQLAYKHKLISKNDLTFINDLRVLRNQVAHRELINEITETEAKVFANKTNGIIKRLRLKSNIE